MQRSETNLYQQELAIIDEILFCGKDHTRCRPVVAGTSVDEADKPALRDAPQNPRRDCSGTQVRPEAARYDAD